MQAASSSYLPPHPLSPPPPPQPPQSYYQGLYHIQSLGPQDHELKRQYLGLLETKQVIEICLMLDVYVAPYVRGMIWPQDLGAAITGLRKSTTSNGGANGASTAAGVGASAATTTTSNDDDDASVSTTRSGRKEGEEEPVMASLDGLKEGSGGRVVENGERVEKASQEVTTATTTEMETAPMSGLAQVSTSSTGASATPAPTSSTPAPTSSTPAPASAAPAPAPAPNQQQPPYPHQPYGYPQHPTAAYPHAPYYPPPPPGYPSYPPSSYPHYPPPPNGYPTAPGGYPLPYSTPSSHPHQQSFPHLHPPPPHPQSHAHQEQTPDEIPSYEEMIVEALQESASADPEGCAPKDLFSWMAARYPLQSNFRPSASQALQKAFKRGRLEKSSNGKYRLSGTWEGGSTSRRTTRRPQMQQHSQPNAMVPPSASSSHPQLPPSGSPFTHAPLVHHHHHNAHASAYPYAYGYPGYPQIHLGQQQQQPSTTDNSVTKNTTGDKTTIAAATSDESDKDAYEAAQNILKAINFGDLLQISQSEEGGNNVNNKGGGAAGGGGDAGEVSMDQLTSLLIQAQHAISGQRQSMEGQQQQQQQQQVAGALTSSLHGGVITPLPTLSATAGVAVASSTSTSNGAAASTSTQLNGTSLATTMGVGQTMNVRAELQAQLALLAVQLAELGQEGENGGGGGGGGGNGVVEQLLQSQNGMTVVGSRNEENGIEGPVTQRVITPPMNGLVPLSLDSNPNPNTISSGVEGTTSVSASALESQTRLGKERKGDDDDDDSLIDPVLRNASVVVVGNSTSSMTPPTSTSTSAESMQTLVSAVSETITGSVNTITTALSLDQEQDQQRSEGNEPSSSMMVGGDGDDDDDGSDDDMEEII